MVTGNFMFPAAAGELADGIMIGTHPRVIYYTH